VRGINRLAVAPRRRGTMSRRRRRRREGEKKKKKKKKTKTRKKGRAQRNGWKRMSHRMRDEECG
jgi:hypothetical protein